MARRAVRAGQSIAIPAGHRYSFRSAKGYESINYRRDASILTFDPRKPGWIETPESLGMTRIAAG